MGGIADAVIGDPTLWEVVGADLRRAVASGDKTLPTVGDIIDILLMFLVIDKGIQTRQGAFLVLGLVARRPYWDSSTYSADGHTIPLC